MRVVLRPRDLALVLFCTVAWGANFVVIKSGLAEVPPLMLAAVRFGLVALLATVLPRPPGPSRDWLAYGFSWGVLYFGCLFVALRMGMPTGMASILSQIQVVFTTVLAIVYLGEKPRPVLYGAGMLGAAGLVLIAAGRPSSMPLAAVPLLVLGAGGYAVGNIVVRRRSTYGERESFLAFIAWSSIVPGTMLFGASMVVEGASALQASTIGLGARAAVSLLYQVAVSTIGATLAWNHVLARYPATSVVPYSLIVPIVGLLSGSLVYGETLEPVQALGCALLVAGLVATLIPGRPSSATAASRGRTLVEANRGPDTGRESSNGSAATLATTTALAAPSERSQPRFSGFKDKRRLGPTSTMPRWSRRRAAVRCGSCPRPSVSDPTPSEPAGSCSLVRGTLNPAWHDRASGAPSHPFRRVNTEVPRHPQIKAPIRGMLAPSRQENAS